MTTKTMEKVIQNKNDRILFVDDEKSMREFMEIMLTKEGYSVLTASSGEEGLDVFKANEVDMVITDIKMGGMSGVEFLKKVKSIDKSVVIIMITAYASVDTAIDAMKAGAYDYFTKPFNIEDIKIHISRAFEWQRTGRENVVLKKEIKRSFGFREIVGTSTKMESLYETIMSVASTGTNILISGESGTGKELVARAVHRESDRESMPFVAINCGAIPETLIESELFGHERGAFTGAVDRKKGLAELAEGGTLFLDEITELPLAMQVKLLRFIQEKTFKRVGGTTDITVDIRFVAASNREIESEVKNGNFREDLYYRLNVINIKMPNLRERKEDLPVLVDHFIKKYTKNSEKKINSISEEAMKVLLDYNYPGNVRELENIIEASVALEKSSVISLSALPDSVTLNKVSSGNSDTLSLLDFVSSSKVLPLPDDGLSLDSFVEKVEKKLILSALESTGGAKKKAAELLGLSFRSFRYKADKYGIE